MDRTEKILSVTGMTCPSCVTLITQAVESLPGAVEARGDLSAGTFQIVYDTAQIKPEAIIQAVVEAGKLGEWQHTFSAEVLE